ncbi:MAG: hypothetical protein ACLPWD_07650, partial [Methanobacterium sp.]
LWVFLSDVGLYSFLRELRFHPSWVGKDLILTDLVGEHQYSHLFDVDIVKLLFHWLLLEIL